ncbi:hypothetical protein JCM8547_004633 [Rhodosporidiobolus lusitaniae]
MSSSRLKRKLETGQLDDRDYGNLTESFVTVGTALPALTDKKADKNEFKPVWEQEVTDEQGRRRFHGAFTGGFSAGYFNTVGSKEGWTPSTFKSSRTNRATQNQGSVQDAARQFMDEEDLAEFASSRTLETSSSYASRSGPPPSASKPPQGQAEYDPLLGLFGPLSSSTSSSATAIAPAGPPTGAFDATLAGLIAPSSSRVGLKLMRKMGWRDGQGVGPRITLSQRKKQAAEMGLALPGAGDGEEEESEEASKHLYAPLDRPLTLVKGTSASVDKGWGLGYEPGMTLRERVRSEGKGGGGGGGRMTSLEEDVYGGGAGLGALGERERRAIRVYEEDEEEEEDLDKISRTNGRGRGTKVPPKHLKPQQEFVDGTKLLSGFVLQREPVAGPSTSKLPPPPPAGWRPDPTRLWKENTPPSASTDARGKGRQLDAEERGSLLGEKAPPPLPAMPKSVFDYLSAKSRERLATVTGGGNVPSGGAPPPPPSSLTGANTAPLGAPRRGGTIADSANSAPAAAPPPPPPEPDAQLFVPPLDRPTALAALRGFQPYSAASTSPDPIKQTRYTLYLQYQSSGTASTSSSPFGPRVLPSGKMQTVEELNRELNEYAQAARVFKPVGGMLGSRFQSSTTGSFDAPKIEPGLYQPPPKSASSSASNPLLAQYGDASSTPSAPLKPPEPELTPAQQAARAGNFGPGTTRTTSVFRPAKLLCKRFGVRDPYESAPGEDPMEAGGKWAEATSTGWGTGNATEAGGGRTREAVGENALEEMRNSAGFKRFQAAAEAEENVRDDEVAKGVFVTPDFKPGGEGGAKKKRVKPTLETVGLGDNEEQGMEIVEEKKAPADIFAAIFADSDDDDDEEDEEEDEERVVEPSQPVVVGEAATVLAVDKIPPSAATAFPALPEEPAVSLSLDTLPSYRPSFVSRTANTTAPSTSTSSTKKEKEKKSSSSSKKSKKRSAGALSFDVDNGGAAEEGGENEREKERSAAKKKARREKEKEREKRSREDDGSSRGEKRRKDKQPKVTEEEDEWAEAAPQVHPSILASLQGGGEKKEVPLAGEKQGRMRAVDLY